MELKMFSIRDSKGAIYNQPMFARSHGEAERAFQTEAQNTNSMINKFPEDFDLFFIGTYDDQTGKVDPLPTPQHIVKAADLNRTQ